MKNSLYNLVKKTIVILILSCIMQINIYAQKNSNKTKYQIRREDIANKYTKKMMDLSRTIPYSFPSYDETKDYLMKDNIIEMFELSVTINYIKKKYGKYDRNAIILHDTFSKALKEIKASMSLQNDKDKKRIKKSEILNKSDYKKKLITPIKTEFIKWLEKGEFEKTIDYQKRISSNAKFCLDSLCRKKINELQLDEKFELSRYQTSYDADKEVLTIKPKKQSEFIFKYTPEEAEKFISSVSDNNYELKYVCLKMDNEYNFKWAKAILGYKYNYDYNDNKKNIILGEFENNTTLIKVFFDDFDIDLPELKGYIFSWTSKDAENWLNNIIKSTTENPKEE